MNGAVLLAALASLAAVGLAAASGVLISRAALQPDDFLSLTLLVTTVRALGVGRAALRYAERLTGHAHALALGAHLRLQWFDTISRFGRDLLSLERRGDLLSRAQADVDARQMWTLRVPLPLLSFIAVASAITLITLLIDPLLAALTGVPLLVTAGHAATQRHPAAALAQDRQELRREHSARLLDAVAGSADSVSQAALPHLTALNRAIMVTAGSSSTLAWQFTLTRELMFALAVSGALWRGADLVTAGRLTGAWLAGLVLATAAAFEAATLLTTLPAAHAERISARNRTRQWRDQTPLVVGPPSPQSLPDGPLELDLRGVTVRLGERTILNGVHLHVAAGRCVVLTGPSGAGKSTLLHLLTRDLDPDQGEVTLSGIPLPTAALSDVRRALSLHPQQSPLLDGSLRENLRLADPNLTDEQLKPLLTQFALDHLCPDHWVGEGGTQLSGGERARVSILRALLAPSRIVVLDEPTAHLDPDTELLVLKGIQANRQGRTLIIASHRPAPLALADQIYRLQDGQLHPLPAASTQKKVI